MQSERRQWDFYAGIDIGLNNLTTIGFNNGKGLIINGRPLKSINQYYNKKKSELSSELEIKAKIAKDLTDSQQREITK